MVALQELEEQEADFVSTVNELTARLYTVEQAQAARDEAEAADMDRTRIMEPEETTRGFEQVGSAWRFAVGSSYLEISDNGIQLQSAGDLTVGSAQRLDLTSETDLRLDSSMNLQAGVGAGIELEAGHVEVVAGSGRLGLTGGNAFLSGSLVILGPGGTSALTQSLPVTTPGSLVKVNPISGDGWVLENPSPVRIAN
ncbi:MAG: hypothetical protein WEA09_03635 [Gemmatimonadota bacterium]